jgi:hypothetical protein
MTDQPHRSSRPTPLADLILKVWDNGRISFRMMADRADQAMHHATIHTYARNTAAKAPNSDQIHALALALQVPVDTVRDAVFEQFYGYVPVPRSGGGRTPATFSRDGGLVPADVSDEERAELETLIRAWIIARRATPSVLLPASDGSLHRR